MDLTVIVIEDNKNYREIVIAFLQRNDVTVLGSFSHQEFLDLKPDLVADIALISFRTAMSFTLHSINFLNIFYKTTKVALLVSVYDSVTPLQLKTLNVHAGLRKAGDDPYEILTLLEYLMAGNQYYNY